MYVYNLLLLLYLSALKSFRPFVTLGLGSRLTLHPQSGSHLVLKADVFSPLNLHPAVIASTVLQGGTIDPQ